MPETRKQLVVFYEPASTVERAVEGLSAATYDSPAQAAAAEGWDESQPIEYLLGVWQALTGIEDRSAALSQLNTAVLREMTKTGRQE